MAQDHFKTPPDPKKGFGIAKNQKNRKNLLELVKKNAKNNIPLKIVSDQVSCPTSTYSLSRLCWELILNKESFVKTCLLYTSDAADED